MVTILDVARRAGVSTATVSHVVNGTRMVAPETRRVVEEAIEALRYRPSAVARGLQSNITQTVGVLVADISSYFFAQIVRELEAVFEPEHYNLLLCNTDEQPEREKRYLEMLHSKRVDGIIMVPTGVDQPILRTLIDSKVPIVAMHRKLREPALSAVLSDDEDSAYTATDYLVKLGHRRIGVLARAHNLSPVIQRTHGYMRALRANWIPIDQRLIEVGHQSTEQATRAAKRLFAMNPPITAVIAMSLTSSLGLLKAMRELGVSYPDQVSVIGIGDAPWMEVLSAPLTVMAAPVDEMCNAAGRLILDALAQGRKKRGADYGDSVIQPVQDVLVKSKLIVRESCKEIRT